LPKNAGTINGRNVLTHEVEPWIPNDGSLPKMSNSATRITG
jgi:hypothetical protein